MSPSLILNAGFAFIGSYPKLAVSDFSVERNIRFNFSLLCATVANAALPSSFTNSFVEEVWRISMEMV